MASVLTAGKNITLPLLHNNIPFMLMTETIQTQRLKPQAAAAIKVTPREQQILHLVAAGHTSKLMATQLSLSVRTVERHRANLLKKFSQKNSVTLVQSAIRHGLL